jgi:hypothetical protein
MNHIRQQTERLTDRFAHTFLATKHPDFHSLVLRHVLAPDEPVSRQRKIVLESGGDVCRSLVLEHYTDAGAEALAMFNPTVPPPIGTLAVRLIVDRWIIAGPQTARRQSVYIDACLTEEGVKSPFLERETPIDPAAYVTTKEELGHWGVQLRGEIPPPGYERVTHLDPLPDAGDIIAASLAELT